MGRLVKDGNKVYEIDEECMRQKEKRQWHNVQDRTAFGRRDRTSRAKQNPQTDRSIQKYPY